MFASIFGCASHNKLKVETILVKPFTSTSLDKETGRRINTSSYIPLTSVLEPAILFQSNYNNQLSFRIQGNITSGGLSIQNVKRIRFKQGEKSGNHITIKYFVEIIHIGGKEGNNVRGYNYTKDIIYKIPEDVKFIKVELYEDRITQKTGSKHPKLKLIASQEFDFWPKI